MAETIHDTTGLNRAQRRRMEALAEKIDFVTKADAAFFKRRPDRNHRMRRMAGPEFEQLRLISGDANAAAPAGEEWAVLVRQIAPGARMRRFARVRKGQDYDLPETVCRDLFDEVAGDSAYAKAIEKSLRSAMEGQRNG